MNEARVRASIDAYVAAWNERDGALRKQLIEQSCAPDLVLCTARRRVEGREQLAAMIADFQERCRGARAVLASEVDIQGNLVRYAGRVEGVPSAPANGEALDTAECDGEGRIRILLTFIGAALPPA